MDNCKMLFIKYKNKNTIEVVEIMIWWADW